MGNKEIGIKLQFKNKRKVIAVLGKKLKFQKKAKIYDKYYGMGSPDMKNTHGLVRIREKDNCAELTYKGAASNKGNICQRKELTVNISSAKQMGQILEYLGFKKISEYQSEREYYKYGGLEIVFVKFKLPGNLSFMEIEGNSGNEINKVVKILGNSAVEVGEEIFKKFDSIR